MRRKPQEQANILACRQRNNVLLQMKVLWKNALTASPANTNNFTVLPWLLWRKLFFSSTCIFEFDAANFEFEPPLMDVNGHGSLPLLQGADCCCCCCWPGYLVVWLIRVPRFKLLLLQVRQSKHSNKNQCIFKTVLFMLGLGLGLGLAITLELYVSLFF